MKIVAALTVVALIAAMSQAICAAQTPPPLTRTEVRAQMLELESVDRNPGKMNKSHYPADARAMQARVEAKRAAAGFEPEAGGTSQGGTSAH